MNNPIVVLLALFFCLSSAIPATGWPLKPPKQPDRIWQDPEWARERSGDDPVWNSMKQLPEGLAGTLSLVRLIDIALQNNPETRQAWRDSKAAFARERQAQSAWFPSVTFSAGSSHRRTYTNNDYNSANTRTDALAADIKFMVLDFGGRAASVKEANEMLLASNYDFNQTFQDLMLNVEKAYYNLYASVSQIKAAEANLEDSAKALETANQKFDSGLVTKLDVLQAESEYTKAQYDLEGARRDGMDAQAQLANVIGVPAGAEIEISPPPFEKPRDVMTRDVRELIEEAMSRRPDIAAARAALESKKAALQSANSDLWPTLNVGGSVTGNRYYQYGSEKDGLFNVKDDYGYVAYVSVDWNVFDGFYLYSVRNEAREQMKAEMEKLRKAELDASSDVWSKYYSYLTALRQYDFSVNFLRSSEASYELALLSYENGLKDILDLLRSSSDLFEGRSNMVSAQESLFVAFAELVHAMGMLYVTEE